MAVRTVAVLASTLSLVALPSVAPPLVAQDFGDAPDPPYRSRQASGGPVHLDTSFEWLGTGVTDEPDAYPGNGDADDGVHLRGPYLRGTTAGLRYVVRVAHAAGGRYGTEPSRQVWVHGFADWNGDGDFDDPGEVLFAQGHDPSQFPTERNQQAFDVSFPVPDQPLAAVVWFRVRLDYGENLASPYGSAQFGEVEDWRTSTRIVPDQHPTVQAAIDAADPGDVIVIRPGTYDESVTVRKEGLALVGTPGATVLRGRGAGSGVAVVHYQAQSGRVVGLVLTGGSYGLLVERPTVAGIEGSTHFDIGEVKLEGNNWASKVDFDGSLSVVETEAGRNVTAGFDVASATDVDFLRFDAHDNNRFALSLRIMGDAHVKDSTLADHTETNLNVYSALRFAWENGEINRAGTGMRLESLLSATLLQAHFNDNVNEAVLLPAAAIDTTFTARQTFCRSSSGVFFAAEERANLHVECADNDVEGTDAYLRLGAGLVLGRVNDRGSRIWDVSVGIEWTSMEPGATLVAEEEVFGVGGTFLRAGLSFDRAGGGANVTIRGEHHQDVTDDWVVLRNLGTGTATIEACDVHGVDADKTGVLIDNCANVAIDGCTLDRFKAGGIALTTCSGTVSNTTVTHSGTGVTLDACTSLTLGNGNDLEANDADGVATRGGCQGVTIANSTISGNRANGLRLGDGSGVTVRGNEIVGNGGHGVYDTGVANLAVQSNKICCNSLAGVAIAAPVSASVTGNILQVNGTFELDNRSPASIDATNNDWGPATTVQMRSGEPNITRIFDCYDASSSGCVTYRPWADPTNTCEPDCFLLLGAIPVYWPIPFSPQDAILVQPVWLTGVTMTTMPTFALPPEIGLRGLHVFFQVYLHNERAYPLDPVKTSNGLDIELDIAATSYGTATGMTLWADGPPRLGTTLVLRFRIGP